MQALHKLDNNLELRWKREWAYRQWLSTARRPNFKVHLDPGLIREFIEFHVQPCYKAEALNQLLAANRA